MYGADKQERTRMKRKEKRNRGQDMVLKIL